MGPHRSGSQGHQRLRLLGAILKERMLDSDGYEKAMRRALARKPFLKTQGRYLSREEVHDRAGLR